MTYKVILGVNKRFNNDLKVAYRKIPETGDFTVDLIENDNDFRFNLLDIEVDKLYEWLKEKDYSLYEIAKKGTIQTI